MNGTPARHGEGAGELRVGLLDVFGVEPGRSPAQTLQVTREIARKAAAGGCARYWLAEHHGGDVACATPDVMAGVLAEATSDIRIGVAGVLLRYQAPLRVVESFRLLQTLYPGRIDLGIARGLADPATAHALLDGRPPLNRDAYERRIVDVLRYLRGAGPVIAAPSAAATSDIWVLGKSRESAEMAARLGVCYSHALFLGGDADDPDALLAYRSAFRANELLEAPRCNVAVGGLLAATPAAAAQLGSEYDNPFMVPYLAGDVAAWAEALAKLQARFRIDEVVYLDLCQRLEDRLRTVDLLMRARAGAQRVTLPGVADHNLG